jgi:predicted  nucleic acid-binding Zn-ribbon protein
MSVAEESPGMKVSLERLLELQEIDKAILALRKSQEDFPVEIARLRTELKVSGDQIQAKRDRVEELEKNQRTAERELEALGEDMKKHQDRLYEVKSNREYDAIQQEIESLRTRINEHETTALECLEEIEELNATFKEDEALFKTLKGDRDSQIGDLEGRLNSVEKDVSGCKKKREAVAKHVEKRPLSIYSRIQRTVRNGLAAVSVEKGACGGCYRQLAPQRMVEVRRMEAVNRCENCGRILIWKEEVRV